MANGRIELKIGSEDGKVGYVSLPDHPRDTVPGCVSYQKRLADLIEDYEGPDLYFDFDKNGCLIGIEILA